MANAGWEVQILNAPISRHKMPLEPHPQILVSNIGERSSHIVRAPDLLHYAAAATGTAITFRPHVVYASDPFAAGPALAVRKLARAILVYHEHDTPNPGTLNPWIARFRATAARKAKLVVFPNAARAALARQQLGFADEQLRIVWNVPRRDELPDRTAKSALVLHYHGNISPQLLPESIIDALNLCASSWRLTIVGYEAPSAAGYALRLVKKGEQSGRGKVEYSGHVSRHRLLAKAAQASVGLALLPSGAGDLNLTHIIGASNKVFDYMAAGLALLVPDGPDWIRHFVEPGYGKACDPADARSIAAQLDWFADHPEECRAMGERARRKIEQEWNYQETFHAVLTALDEATRAQ
jgi:glycosyltransferase involved in cell wall biosynthesis